jgi:hypothetical protein
MYLPFTRSDFKNFPATILIALSVLISIFHFPLFYIKKDSVGIFDFYVIFLFFCIIIRGIYKHRFTLGNWKALFAAIFASICYYLLRLDYYSLTDYKLFLILKYLEHFFLFFVFVYFLENEKINYPMLMKLIKIILVVLTLFQINEWLGGGPARYRLSLPFTLTVSPNPAAFVLGAALIFFIEYMLRKKQKLIVKLIDIGIFVLIIISLLLTLSRTNFIAIIASFGIVYFFKGFKDPKRLVITVSIIALLIIAFYTAVSIAINTMASPVMQCYAYMITDPTTVFSDPSFYARFSHLWPDSLNAWQENIFTFFFGKGLGYFFVVDGTFPRLLGNQGLVGTVLFIYVWFAFFLRRYRFTAMWLLLVFIAINAITADTLVVSYRSIQGYVAFLMMTIYFHQYYNENERTEDREVITEQI